MTITDERINEIAADSVTHAIRNLASDWVGLGERLEDADELNGLTGNEQEAVLQRLEAAILAHLPGDDETAPDIHCTVCGGIVLCTDGDWWHENDAADLDHDASPPDEE